MSTHSRLIARAGVILFALSLANGFLVHVLALRDRALAAHLIGLIGSVFLLTLACLWPSLNQKARASGFGALLAVYGFGMGWLVNFAAAILDTLVSFQYQRLRLVGGCPVTGSSASVY